MHNQISCTPRWADKKLGTHMPETSNYIHHKTSGLDQLTKQLENMGEMVYKKAHYFPVLVERMKSVFGIGPFSRLANPQKEAY